MKQTVIANTYIINLDTSSGRPTAYTGTGARAVAVLACMHAGKHGMAERTTKPDLRVSNVHGFAVLVVDGQCGDLIIPVHDHLLGVGVGMWMSGVRGDESRWSKGGTGYLDHVLMFGFSLLLSICP